MVGVNLINHRVRSSIARSTRLRRIRRSFGTAEGKRKCPGSADGAICEIGGVWTSMPIGGKTQLAISAEPGA